MGNFLQVASFGQKLFRTFGKGVKTRHIITETINGKTFTRVLDAEGKVRYNRIKTIKRFEVGDKRITSCTKDFNTHTSTVDRVVDHNGNYLGNREVVIRGVEKDVFKSVAGNYTTNKEVICGITNKKYCFDKDKVLFENCKVEYNNLGLPVPKELKYYKCEGKSLQEMLKMTGVISRCNGYYPKNSKLDHITPKFDLENYVKNMSWEA